MKLIEWRKNSSLPCHETDILIEHVCNISKLDILFNGNTYELSSNEEHLLDLLSKKRIEDSFPLQYLLGYTYFRGEKYIVTPDVLIPRYDTETLISAVNQLIDSIHKKNPSQSINVLDLCTGSGCIACSLARENPSHNVSITASDISLEALKIAQQNGRELRINFIQSDLFENVKDTFDIIVSNPPYISKSEMHELDKEVYEYEPHLALYGGEDGLDIYKKISYKISEHTKPASHVFLEIGYSQSKSVIDIFSEAFSNSEIIKDINEKDRVIHLFNS